MCWCWPFSGKPPPKKKNRPKSREARSEKHAYEGSVAEPVVVAYPAPEPPRPREQRRAREPRPREPRPREPRTPRETKPPQQAQRPREAKSPRQPPRSPEKRTVRETPRPRDARRPTVQLQVPDRWHRPVEPAASPSSSTEMLLNPRPDRSRQHRQRHGRSSTSTLRGRGAKRDPPSSKSKKSSKPETKKSQWTRIPSPPKSTSRRDAPSHQQSQQRSPRQHHSSRSSRSRTPNTTARRVPDRRFAVLAATNQALEDIRREAFTYPSPPLRTTRVQRYQGVALETSAIPFHWDCISNSYQPTVSESSRTTGRHRRSRR